MNTLVKIVAALLIATVALGGCTLTRGSHLIVGSTRAPTNPADVRIYTELPAKYEKIAMVSADSRNAFAGQQNLSDHAIERLKEEAAKVGANGILLNGFGNYQVGSQGVVIIPNSNAGYSTTGVVAMSASTGKEATGLAIYVPQN
jgi:uncharacterized protein YbjQ (UPF0145 family)